MTKTITLDYDAIVDLATELASYPWGNDEPISGSDLVNSVGCRINDFLSAVEDAGVTLPEDWKTLEVGTCIVCRGECPPELYFCDECSSSLEADEMDRLIAEHEQED
jgi:hypothetical protein